MKPTSPTCTGLSGSLGFGLHRACPYEGYLIASRSRKISWSSIGFAQVKENSQRPLGEERWRRGSGGSGAVEDSIQPTLIKRLETCLTSHVRQSGGPVHPELHHSAYYYSILRAQINRYCRSGTFRVSGFKFALVSKSRQTKGGENQFWRTFPESVVAGRGGKCRDDPARNGPFCFTMHRGTPRGSPHCKRLVTRLLSEHHLPSPIFIQLAGAINSNPEILHSCSH